MRIKKKIYLVLHSSLFFPSQWLEQWIYLFERDIGCFGNHISSPEACESTCSCEYDKCSTVQVGRCFDMIFGWFRERKELTMQKNGTWSESRAQWRLQIDKREVNIDEERKRKRDIQLLNQFEAVESATPLLLIDNGNTSLGKTQPLAPMETPYAAVNVYIPLNQIIYITNVVEWLSKSGTR